MTGQTDLPADLASRADELLHRTPNANQLAGLATEAFEASRLDHDTLVLVWLAALVALDASSESYLLNLGAASQAGVSLEQIHQVLTALAPVVGTPRVVSASFKIEDALGPGA